VWAKDSYYFTATGGNDAVRFDIAQTEKIKDPAKGILDTITPTEGQIAKVGDRYYLYVSYNGKAPKWYRANGNYDDFDATFDQLSAASGGAKRPKHSED
jgi:hypothetical protein